MDTESGLYNYDARLYDPVIGRFVTADTMVSRPFNPQSLNRYSYCRNNPLIYVDPTGHYDEGADVQGALAGHASGLFDGEVDDSYGDWQPSNVAAPDESDNHYKRGGNYGFWSDGLGWGDMDGFVYDESDKSYRNLGNYGFWSDGLTWEDMGRYTYDESDKKKGNYGFWGDGAIWCEGKWVVTAYTQLGIFCKTYWRCKAPKRIGDIWSGNKYNPHLEVTFGSMINKGNEGVESGDGCLDGFPGIETGEE